MWPVWIIWCSLASSAIGLTVHSEYSIIENIMVDDGWPEASIICEEIYCDALHDVWRGELPVTWLVVEGNVMDEIKEDVVDALTHTRDLGSKHVILAAGNDVIARTMEQANVLDRHLEQDGVIVHSYDWVVTGWSRDLPELAALTGGVVNVALIVNETDLYTSQFAPSGREFSPVGEGEVFPNRKYGMNGKHFLVGTNYWGLFMYELGREVDDFNGVCVDIMNSMSRKLNFTYEFVLPPDMGWGAKTNGTWNGLGGQFQRREVNLVCAAYTLTYQRTEVCDLTTVPFFIEDSVIVYRRPNPDDEAITLFIRPLSPKVWAVMLVSILFSSLSVWLLAFISPAEHSEFKKFKMGVWYTVQVSVNQGAPKTPVSSAARIAFACFWVATLILVVSYGGNLMSSLTVAKFTPPFTTLAEMSEQTLFKFGTISDSCWETKFKEATNPVDKKIWDRIQAWENSGEAVMHAGVSDQKALVDGGGFAAVTDISVASQLMQENCDLVMAPERFLPNNYPVYLQKNSAYTGIVSDVLSDLIDTGTMAQFIKAHQTGAPPCDAESANKVLSVFHLQGVFYILAAGVGLGLVALIVENIVARSMKKVEDIKSPRLLNKA